MHNNSETNGQEQSIDGYAEQSSALAHSILVKLESGPKTSINASESVNLASDLSHIWASSKMVESQIQAFCASENGEDETCMVKLLTNIEHLYSHALSSMGVLSKMMKINSVVTETEF